MWVKIRRRLWITFLDFYKAIGSAFVSFDYSHVTFSPNIFLISLKLASLCKLGLLKKYPYYLKSSKLLTLSMVHSTTSFKNYSLYYFYPLFKLNVFLNTP